MVASGSGREGWRGLAIQTGGLTTHLTGKKNAKLGKGTEVFDTVCVFENREILQRQKVIAQLAIKSWQQQPRKRGTSGDPPAIYLYK